MATPKHCNQKILLLIVLTVFCSANTVLAETQVQELHFQVNNHSPKRILRFHTKVGAPYTEYTSILDEAEIVDAHTKKLIQRLLVPNEGSHLTLPFNPADLDASYIFKDVNFDENQDIVIHSGSYVSGNTSNAFWLYNKKTEKYVYNSALSDLSNVTIDPQKKLISSSSSCCAGLSAASEIYDWKGEELELLETTSRSKLDPQPILEAPDNCPNPTWVIDTTTTHYNGKIEERKSDPYAMCG